MNSDGAGIGLRRADSSMFEVCLLGLTGSHLCVTLLHSPSLFAQVRRAKDADAEFSGWQIHLESSVGLEQPLLGREHKE